MENVSSISSKVSFLPFPPWELDPQEDPRQALSFLVHHPEWIEKHQEEAKDYFSGLSHTEILDPTAKKTYETLLMRHPKLFPLQIIFKEVQDRETSKAFAEFLRSGKLIPPVRTICELLYLAHKHHVLEPLKQKCLEVIAQNWNRAELPALLQAGLDLNFTELIWLPFWISTKNFNDLETMECLSPTSVPVLNLDEVDDITDKDLLELSEKIPHLKKLKIRSENITAIPFKNLDQLDCSGCSITELSLPVAKRVICSCRTLTKLSAPRATFVEIVGCPENIQLDVPLSCEVIKKHDIWDEFLERVRFKQSNTRSKAAF